MKIVSYNSKPKAVREKSLSYLTPQIEIEIKK